MILNYFIINLFSKLVRMRNTTLLFLICLTINADAQDDYRIYHRWINNAERCFFLEHKTDSAYSYYDLAFSKFDFVFAKDCFMAAQIGAYNGNDNYLTYLEKGIKNGLTYKHIRLSPILVQSIKDNSAFKKKFPNYATLRTVYLKRINVDFLTRMTRMCVQDQSQKLLPEKQYAPILYKNILSVEATINSVGFPGEKLLGISQADILQELGRKRQDYHDYPWGHNFDGDSESIAQESVLYLFIHQRCSWSMFEKYWDKLIALGQAHPRDVAMLHDEEYHLAYLPHEVAENYSCHYGYPFGCYRTNAWIDYTVINYSRQTIDSMRQALYINTMAVDSAQKVFIEKHNFRSTLDVWERF